VGEVGLDYIKHTKLLSKRELEKQTGFQFGKKNILVTFHPETIGDKSAKEQIAEILKALDMHEDIKVVFTMPNADMDGKVIWEACLKYQKKYSGRISTFVSLGRHRYLSMMKYMDAVVGNTSSGIVEAPSLRVASINIGSRQTGRIRASSVIDVSCNYNAIDKALDKIYSTSYKKLLSGVKNPYGRGSSSLNLLKVLKKEDFKKILVKKFYDKK
jgi:UDP-hydrolysing UDP-N-acetyl-D-glucosamine 2-epimerase